MPSVALLPTIALIVGVAAGIASDAEAARFVWPLLLLYPAALAAWSLGRTRCSVVAVTGAFVAAGGALGAAARGDALGPSLRVVLDRAIGGVRLESLGPAGEHDPIAIRARLVEDAVAFEDYASLRVIVTAVRLDGVWQPGVGGVRLTVGGTAFRDLVPSWRAGRALTAPVTFRRPVRYLNDGVPDLERNLALAGTTLFGSIKSGLLIDGVERGSRVEEWAGDIRARVRRAVDRHVSRRDAVSGALVAAVLIGDRAGLPDDVRERLQKAGTYHVIAISGGNIAILAALGVGGLALIGVRGRAAALALAFGLLVYAQVVAAGPSVWRATAMAVVYLLARSVDHRTPPWQAMAVSAGLMAVTQPLDVRDAGFVLTFGATGALLEGARRATRAVRVTGPMRWIVGSVAASVAVEAVLMPVSAQIFSRVTVAGLLLNLAAVPLMGIVQVAGLVVASVPAWDGVASPSGWVAHLAASALVDSARLVEAAPWLSVRVPPPGPLLLVAYYGGLAALLFGRTWLRRGGTAILAPAALLIVIGWTPGVRAVRPDALRLTVFDVGQAESMLLEFPGGRTLLVDSGGVPFGEGLDIGARVLAPALWARGHRQFETLLITHGDPDHLGGAAVLVDEFRPRHLWEGVIVPAHAPMAAVRDLAARHGARPAALRAGGDISVGGVRLRVLHPPEPDWERPRVRNDDSVVLEVLYHDVAMLLTGDVSAATERALLPQLTQAPVRILKVAHHGSRTSTSQELLDAWRPHYALISAGRGNSFGHPAPEVLRRLDAIGATVLRTDLHGQITLETDGHTLDATSYVGRR